MKELTIFKKDIDRWKEVAEQNPELKFWLELKEFLNNLSTPLTSMK